MKPSLSAIIHGRDVYLDRDNHTAKPHHYHTHLASNENPNGPSPKVVQTLKNIIPNTCRYPNDSAPLLMPKLAEYCNVSEEQIMIGAGSTDLVEMIIRALTPENKKVLFPKASYPIYRNFAHANHIEIAEIDVEDFANYTSNIIARIQKDDIGLVIIDNPNNPTGHYLSFDTMKQLINSIPNDIAILIDEAYFEFLSDRDDYQSAISLIKEHHNLLVTRSFSKIFGLASLRIGYAVAHPNIIDHISHYKRIFDVSSPAIAAATTALDDTDYIQHSFEINAQGLDYLTQSLNTLGVKYIKPSANYICIHTGEQTDSIYQAILQQGILVKSMHNYHLANHIRVSIGLAAENKMFIEQFAKITKQYKLI